MTGATATRRREAAAHGAPQRAIPYAEIPSVPAIPIALIDIPPNRSRELDEAWVEVLAGMIAEAGLINPITVMPEFGRFRLISGLHRLSAFVFLGLDDIPAHVSSADSTDEAKLEEIVENIGRNDLKALDRAHHLHDLIQVYERLHPELKRGGDRGNQHTGGKRQTAILAVRQEIAERAGLSERAIRLSAAIWKGLSAAARQRCAGTWLASHQSSLIALSHLGHTLQAKVLDVLLADKPKATTVADALLIINDGRLLTHVEKKFATINKSLSALKDGELDAVIAVHEERVIASLKRRGRI